MQRFMARQPSEDISDGVRIGMKLGDVMAKIFLARVPQQVQLGLVRPQNSPVGPNPVQAQRRLLPKIGQLPRAVTFCEILGCPDVHTSASYREGVVRQYLSEGAERVKGKGTRG